MQLPDETIAYNFQRLLVPPLEAWTPLAELQSQHFLNRRQPRADQEGRDRRSASQVAAERELTNVRREGPAARRRLHRPAAEDCSTPSAASRTPANWARSSASANRLREEVDRVVVLGIGGSYLGAQALFDALCHTYHNELPAKLRMGMPRIYFEGNNVDNDALQDLLDLLENTCVDPDDPRGALGRRSSSASPAARWRRPPPTAPSAGEVARVLRHRLATLLHAGRSSRSPGRRASSATCADADGFTDDDILTIPDDVGGRFSVFTPVGLLPAAVMGLDVRALLLGAATMTKRFLEEPFERNPVLQYAAVNYLMTEELKKPTRVLSVWSKKLEALGCGTTSCSRESLGKQGRGPTPITAVQTRDLHSRGQQHQDGTRDKVINNLVVKTPKHPPIMIGMADHNEDDLNQFSRKGYPDLLDAAFKGTNQAYADAARPTADIVLPTLTEHTIGQLMQMLMLATVVEGRLMGINPYGQPGVEAYKTNMMRILKSIPNVPKARAEGRREVG